MKESANLGKSTENIAYLFSLGFGSDPGRVTIWRPVHVKVDLFGERRSGRTLGHVIVGLLEGRSRRFFPDRRREGHGRRGRSLGDLWPATVITGLDVLFYQFQRPFVSLGRRTLLRQQSRRQVLLVL